MSRRNKKKITNRAKLIITVVIIAICLFVMHKFDFFTKSEETNTTQISFLESGTEKTKSIDVEYYEDENGNNYIILPEKINGYYAQSYSMIESPVAENASLMSEIEKLDTTTNVQPNSQNNIETNIENTENTLINTETEKKPIVENDKDSTSNTINNEVINNTVINELANTTNNTNTADDSANTLLNTIDNGTNTSIESSVPMVTSELISEDTEKKVLESESTTFVQTNKEITNFVTNTVVKNEIVNESASNTSFTNQIQNVVTNQIIDNTVSENKVIENGDLKNEVTENTVVENTITNNTVVSEKDENTIANNNTISEPSNISNAITDISNQEKLTLEQTIMKYTALAEETTYKPGEKIYLTLEEIESNEYTIEVVYKTVTIEDKVLYYQELTSNIYETATEGNTTKETSYKVALEGYILEGYELILSNVSADTVAGLIDGVKEFEEVNILLGANISIKNGDATYQPKDYSQIVTVTITSDTNIKNHLIGPKVQMLHFKDESTIETVEVTEKTENSIKFATNEFSEYALIVYPAVTANAVTIDDYEADYNYYIGLNHTEKMVGRANPYTDDNLAKVKINYYSYNYNSPQGVSLTLGLSSIENQAAYNETIDGTRYRIVPVKIIVDTKYSIDKISAWTMKFTVPNTSLNTIATELKNPDIISSCTTSGTTLTINSEAVASEESSHWTEENNGTYSVILNLAFSSTNISFNTLNNFSLDIKSKPLVGYVSTTERQTLFSYTKCVPIVNGKVSFELIDNPYMDRPAGYGFNGWKSINGYNIATNANTFAQTLDANIDSQKEITIDLYADWAEANVIFVNTSNTASGRDGSKANPVRTWDEINTRLGANYRKTTTTASNRELNIIVFMNGTLENLRATANSAYTITSIYDGVDYRANATFNINAARTLDQDVQMAFLKVNGPGNYDDDVDGLGNLGSYLKADTYNFRIGRGMMPNDTAYSEATFTQVQGGGDNRNQYRLVIESGKYCNIQSGSASDIGDHTINATVILGNDFDRAQGEHTQLYVYSKFSSRTEEGDASAYDTALPVYHMIVKSGTIGVDCFNDSSSERPYTGIYLGGHGYSGSDINDRVLTVEDGIIANIIGGLGTSSGTKAKSYIYVKDGQITNIVGGAGRSPTYGDRCIQVTGGTVLYSVNGGSNGYLSTNSDNGELGGSSLVYVGGTAIIGGEDQLGTSLYGTEAGCVLGAGNGKAGVDAAGKVDTSHIIIDGNATVNNSVYGGGNYGVVGEDNNNNGGNQGTVTPVIEVTNNSSNYSTNTEYLITTSTTSGNSMSVNGTNIANTAFNTGVMPTNSQKWVLESAGNNRYYIKNVSNNYYLRINNNNLSLTNNNNNRTAFTINANGSGIRLYGGNRYLVYSGGRWQTTNMSFFATTLYFLTYTEIPKEPEEEEESDDLKTVVNIDILSGYIQNNVYGGSNQSEIYGTVEIYMEDGTVNGAIYGGSNLSGTVSGAAKLKIYGGNINAITTDTDVLGDAVFGAGKGQGTEISQRTVIDINDSKNNLNIKGNIYGGSAQGIVGTTSNVTVKDDLSQASRNSITLSKDIYGGGKGATGISARTGGNTTVVVDGGSYTSTSVFGGCNINGDISGAILVKIGENANTNIKEVYGGGNQAEVTNNTNSVYVHLFNNSLVGNAFNGGNSAGITPNNTNTPRAIYAKGARVGNLYGGSNTTGNLTQTFVYVSEGAIIGNVYGGGYGENAGVTADTLVEITDSTITENVYGGGNEGKVSGDSDIDIKKSTITESVYGGGKAADIKATDINIEESNAKNVFGGGDEGKATGDALINILTSNISDTVYGGGNKADVDGNTNVYLELSTAGNVFGGGNEGGIYGTGNVGTNNITSSTIVTIYGSKIATNVFGGGNEGEVTGNTYVNVSDWTVDDITTQSTVGEAIYGGGKAAKVNGTTVNVQKQTQTKNIFGGGDQGEVTNSTEVTVDNSIITNSIYGGGNGAVSSVDTTSPGKVGGNVTLTITNATEVQNHVFGGGQGKTATVEGDIVVDFKESSSVTNDIYGGGDNGPVNGNTNVYISSSSIGGCAYAAGNGASAVVKENSYILAEGTTQIGKSIFGGGNAAETGNKGDNVLAMVDIAGAVIGENVYGGANSSVINGNTVTNIGVTAIDNYYGTQKGFEIGKIEIGGTVFGGGESMIIGSDSFSYDSISVEGTILINIDGDKYDQDDDTTINIYGSVFGSGNASSARTNGDINIRNYGEQSNPKRGISIQRATNVIIDDSALLLNGTTDSTSKHPEGLYTLNRITKLKIKNGTTLYLVNGANLLAGYESLVGEDGAETLATVEIIDTVTDVNGNTYEAINGKVYDNNDNIEYYIKGGVIYRPSNTGEADEEIAQIDQIDYATSINSNVDNRIYMYSGRNLNISDDQDATSKYGEVNGMTFFGIFKSSVDSDDENTGDDAANQDNLADSVYMGMYSPSYDKIGQNIEWEERDFNRSYVLGLHKRDPEHDITKDGFYTVYEQITVDIDENEVLTEENYEGKSYISYITPTPEEDLYYMWYAGPDNEVYYYVLTLTASKHSTLGTKELALLDISYENAEITLKDFDASLITDVGLYDKNTIPNINVDQEAANNNFGLTMKTGNAGWSMTGETDFYATPITETETSTVTSTDGTNVYKIENSKTTPLFNFYFYHSNNITEERELGTCQINMNLAYWKDALNRGNAKIIIDVILMSQVYDDIGYNGAIAPGSQYELFTNSVTNITTKSSFSTYFELSQENFSQVENVEDYYEDSYRVITTEYAFPKDTTITMIDRWDKNNPAYYYYTVTEEDANAGKVEYKFTEFLAMGSLNEPYDETTVRENYYIEEIDYQYESFIFIVNFENAKFDLDENSFQITPVQEPHFRIYLRTDATGDDGKTVFGIGLLDEQIDSIIYGIYHTESTIDIEAELSRKKIFLGNELYLDVNTIYNVKKGAQSVMIYDTRYFDKKLGIKLTFYKETVAGTNTTPAEYEVVSGSELLGTYFELNGEKYYPRADGTTRIKIADLVSNASSSIYVGTENSAIATDSYKILVESFGSADGIYYGVETSSSTNVYLDIINDLYGLNSTLPEEQVIIDKTTGFTLGEDGKISDGANNLNFEIEYLSGLAKPYLTISLYRRDYDETMTNVYENTYTLVDLTEYVNEELTLPIEFKEEDYTPENAEFIDKTKMFNMEYTAFDTSTIKTKVGDNTTTSVTLDLDYTLKDALKSGTYKVEFKLYDIGENTVYKEETDDEGNVVSKTPFDITEYTYIGETFSYIIIK